MPSVPPDPYRELDAENAFEPDGRRLRGVPDRRGNRGGLGLLERHPCREGLRGFRFRILPRIGMANRGSLLGVALFPRVIRYPRRRVDGTDHAGIDVGHDRI